MPVLPGRLLPALEQHVHSVVPIDHHRNQGDGDLLALPVPLPRLCQRHPTVSHLPAALVSLPPQLGMHHLLSTPVELPARLPSRHALVSPAVPTLPSPLLPVRFEHLLHLVPALRVPAGQPVRDRVPRGLLCRRAEWHLLCLRLPLQTVFPKLFQLPAVPVGSADGQRLHFQRLLPARLLLAILGG